MRDDPEPPDAKHTCVFCGRKTYMGASDATHDDGEVVVFPPACSRETCLDAMNERWNDVVMRYRPPMAG